MAATLSNIISEKDWPAAVQRIQDPSMWNWAFILDCFSISIATVTVMVVLELMTWDKEHRKKMEDPRLWALYVQAIKHCAFHFGVIGPFFYGASLYTITIFPSAQPAYISIPGVFACQSFGYACAHAWMHRPGNYWIHKLHHQYNEKSFVRPISANTVTVTEFVVAYVMPIFVGLVTFRPTYEVVWWITMSISLFNLAIHTPSNHFSMKFAPSWMITNDKHFYHHQKDVRRHYSAPIFDLDGILGIGQVGQYKGDPKMN